MWDVGWVQVRTRRPVLFEPLDVNILPFTPGALPRAAEILEKVYGARIEKGPPSRLDRDWPSYDHGRWQSIAREFGVTEVFAESGTIATLPVVADDGRCALYRMPTADTR
jgi:hypothetical protein